MADEFEDYDPEVDPEDDDAEDGDENTEGQASAPSSFGRSFVDLPEGFVTASGFAKVLKERRNTEVRPQVIFATAKSSKTFPAIRHTDGRIIVNVAGGLEWWDNKEQRVAGRASGPRNTEPTAYEKAQAAAAAANAPAQ